MSTVLVRSLAVGSLVLVAATGCTSNSESGASSPSGTSSNAGGAANADAAGIAVAVGDGTCEVSPATAPAGAVSFRVTNNSSAEAEFYVYKEDGTTIVSELENLGPGLERDLDVELAEGKYVTACKSDDNDEGLRGDFAVTSK